jgi:hypothetical protein
MKLLNHLGVLLEKINNKLIRGMGGQEAAFEIEI